MSINNRTVFYDVSGGVCRFADWALVNTTLGTMAEPFMPNQRHLIDFDAWDFDPADECARIDEIKQQSIDTLNYALSGGDHILNGGNTNPRGDRR